MRDTTRRWAAIVSVLTDPQDERRLLAPLPQMPEFAWFDLIVAVGLEDVVRAQRNGQTIARQYGGAVTGVLLMMNTKPGLFLGQAIQNGACAILGTVVDSNQPSVELIEYSKPLQHYRFDASTLIIDRDYNNDVHRSMTPLHYLKTMSGKSFRDSFFVSSRRAGYALANADEFLVRLTGRPG